MRFPAIAAALLTALEATAQSPATALWNELKAKREKLSAIHQEFDVSQTSKTASTTRSSKRQVIIDLQPNQWRERFISGSGTTVTVFNGTDLLRMEEGASEFIRVKRNAKEETPLPHPYDAPGADWSKAIEVERRPCGLSKDEHQCVVMKAPIKPSLRSTTVNTSVRASQGVEAVLLDLETGLILSIDTVQQMERQQGSSYQFQVDYSLKRLVVNAPMEAALFKPPADAQEVKKLSVWTEAKLKKELTGKLAPALELMDIEGKSFTLAAFKGKVVLLDFWATWCGPCRADAPALDKLYQKYSEHDLMIVGISVSEERALVQKFLKDHPHSFPVALTTENEMPRPYQIGVFPTYIVIDRDGAVAATMSGDQGFSELRKQLKKAGLEI